MIHNHALTMYEVYKKSERPYHIIENQETVMTPTFENDFDLYKYELCINIITKGCSKDIGNSYI